GVMHTRVSLADDTGRIVPHRLRAPEIYELPPMPASGVLSLTLQVRTIAGAAFGRVSNVGLAFRADPNEERRFTMTLLRRDAAGIEQVEDEGHFTVAPFILADRIAPARRIYMVRHASNAPSVTDVRAAARAAGVPLVMIDEGLSAGDTWIQDQYQHAMLQGPGGWTELILHLPRLRHENSNATITDNLEDVVNGHFRSRDVGLFRDLWDRIVPTRTADGTVIRPSFRDLQLPIKHVGRILEVATIVNSYGLDAGGSSWVFNVFTEWVDALVALDGELARMEDTINRAVSGASAQRARQLADQKTAARALVDAIRAQFAVTERTSADPVIGFDLGGQRVRLRASVARDLLARGEQMHNSENYGGNFESTPPFPSAPLGAVIVGNAADPDSGKELVDPDLLRVFVKQAKQPIIEINTDWLKVSHVDEVLAVVPSSRASGGFAILHASARAAMELLDQAASRHLLGLPLEHPTRVTAGDSPSGVLPRLMVDGSAPVTRLFRGKAWTHIHSPARGNGVEDYIEPPEIYRRLCRAFGTTTAASGFSVHRIGYVPGPGDDRRYPADITPLELLWAEADRNGTSSNRLIDTHLLEPSWTTLRDAIGTAPILPIPVVFDRLDDAGRLERSEPILPTTAFTPDVVNMQVLNGHILVPRPYGPRMRIADAIAVVQAAMRALDVAFDVRARVGRRLIAAGRMTRGEHWVERVSPAYVTSSSGIILASYGGMLTKEDVVAAFRDSFPGADTAELNRRIIEPNRRHFTADGGLREEFTLFRISDGMVDLFELWIAAVAAELNVRLHFVDSWFYHLGDGQIHCGTNVLHGPPPRGAGLPNVWDAPDHAFRVRAMTFEEEVVGAGG
ncbi:MAG: protein-arginine deiminase domain-containing protein, partial [Actinomycetota bacterium]|nr:protein-arginine deiminase domain-containing protein [Actinomycetota bacterium]